MKKSKIKDALMKILASFSTISTDKGLLKWNSEGELPEVGESVVLVNESGEESTVDNGEFRADGSWLIKVENGVVSEIVDIMEEEKGMEEETPDVKEEVLQDRAEELVDISEEDKSQEEKVEEVKDILEEIVEEVKKIEEEEPVSEEEKMEEDDTMSLEERVAALEAQLAELAAKLAKIESEPAAEPATEEFKKINRTKVTKDEKFSNLGKKLNAKW